MKKVYICSPYRPTGQNPEAERKRNVEKAQTACRLAIDAGYLPLAPHLYFTQMLNDDELLFERFLGMAYGRYWTFYISEADSETCRFGAKGKQFRQAQRSFVY